MHGQAKSIVVGTLYMCSCQANSQTTRYADIYKHAEAYSVPPAMNLQHVYSPDDQCQNQIVQQDHHNLMSTTQQDKNQITQLSPIKSFQN